MPWVSCDRLQRLRRRPEQDIVNHGDLDVRRHGEHDLEIRHVEQFRLPVSNPLGACQPLALRTVSVTTRVVGDTLMTTIAATFDVTAERCRAAVFDPDHCTAARAGKRRSVLLPRSRPEAAEHVRHFEPLARHGQAVRRVSGWPLWLSRSARLPADWPWRRPCWWRYADNGTWCSGCDAPTATEWYGDRHRTPTGERRMHGARNAE